MSGGKGGSSTSSVEIPEYIEAAAQRNLTRAEDVSRMGYVPQYGPQVAALTPMEEAAAQNVAGAASAFGMATPTGTDVYGGMGAPTEYAGGVRGYSSAPLYEQSIAQLQAARPAQYDYMQSFFIDPVTGQRGSRVLDPIDYRYYETNAARARREAQEAAAAAGQGDSGMGVTIDPSYQYGGVNNPIENPTLSQLQASAPAGSTYNEDTQSYIYSGKAPETTSPPQLRPTTFSPPSFDNGSALGDSPTSSQMTTARESGFGSDLSRSLTDPNYDPPGNVVSRALGITPTSDRDSDGQDDSGGGGDGTVMCSAYCRMGYLPKEIWKLDRRYGVKMLRNDPTLIEGYHAWGQPLAAFIQQDTRLAKVARAAMWPIVKAWAEEMAHNMKPQEYKPNYFGKAIKFVGEPFSRLVGKIKPRYVNKEAF